MNQNYIFYFSSDCSLDDIVSFDGYAFFNIDLVIGTKGYDLYKINHKSHELYADGNYILVNKISDNKICITRDYNGFYPLFYYKSSSFWCISNSIKFIIEKIKEKGLALSVNQHNFEIWKSSLALALQLSSHSTFVDQIKVVPVNKDIFIDIKNHSLSFALVNRIPQDIKGDYNAMLSKAIAVWRGRYRTVLNDNNLALHQDLTGGLDSRALLSFLLAEKDLFNYKIMNKSLKVNSQREHARDFEVASKIGQIFSFSLNKDIDKLFKKPNTDGYENYKVWEFFNIGRYAPIIFPLKNFNPKLLELGGEGGESTRVFYGRRQNASPINFYEYLEMYNKFFSSSDIYNNWIDDIRTSIKTIREDNSVEHIKNDGILHYREFRSVHHTSKNPKTRFKFGVLASKYFDTLVKTSSTDFLESSQIMYDIIYNNMESLLFIPFDEHYKSPTSINLDSLSTVGSTLQESEGKVYYDEGDVKTKSLVLIPCLSQEDVGYNGLQYLLQSTEQTLKDRDLLDYYLGREFRESFEKKYAEIDFDRKNLNLHTNGYFLHTLEMIKLIKSFS